MPQDGTDEIIIETFLPEPQSAYFTVRYYNEIGGIDYFYDIPIHVRIKAKDAPVYAD